MVGCWWGRPTQRRRNIVIKVDQPLPQALSDQQHLQSVPHIVVVDGSLSVKKLHLLLQAFQIHQQEHTTIKGVALCWRCWQWGRSEAAVVGSKVVEILGRNVVSRVEVSASNSSYIWENQVIINRAKIASPMFKYQCPSLLAQGSP